MSHHIANPDRAALLDLLERYYDDVPRISTTTEQIGPFTLFVQVDARGWPYYARPTLGFQGPVTVDDLERVRARQRALEVPESLEWVHETSPAVTEAVRRTGLSLGEHPLMVLDRLTPAAPPDGVWTEVLGPDHPQLGEVLAAVSAGFAGTDEVEAPKTTDHLRDRVASGAFRLVGAFDERGALGGGSHAPRAGVTELAGIAVLPRARRRGVGAAITAALVADAQALGVETVFLSAGSQRVADIYARVGFARIGTACVAEATAND